MSRALYEARARARQNPEWAWRIIETEAWAIARPKHSPVVELTGRRGSEASYQLVEAD